MKITFLLLIFLFLIQEVFCNENILSKLHQHTYKIKDVRIQLMNYSKDVYNFFEIKAFKYNRTITAHNVTLSHKVDLADKVECIVQANKFLSNEYRDFPVRFQVNLNKAFQSNAIGLKSINKCGNITSCIFYKDITYHACNFGLDETHFPPLMPNGKFRMDLIMLYLNKEIALIHVYNEVYIPMVYPKK